MNKPDASSWKQYVAAAASALALNGCAEDKPKDFPWPNDKPHAVDNFEKQQPAPKVEHVQPKEDPKITAISEDTKERKRGMDMAQRIIDRRPKSPADFSADATAENPFANMEIVDLSGDIGNEDGDYKRTSENEKANRLFKEVQKLIKESKDGLTLSGVAAQKGQKKFFMRTDAGGEGSDGLAICYGGLCLTGSSFSDGPNSNEVDFTEEKNPEKKKQLYAKMTAMLTEVKWLLQHPIKDTPKFMVVKTVPDTIKNLGANLKGSEGSGRVGILPPNTLVKVIRTDANTGYSYIAGGRAVHSKFLEPYDAGTLHTESFGAKKVRVRKNEETEVEGLNFRDAKGHVIGKISAGTVLDLLAVEDSGNECRALVQYRDPTDGKLKTGFLTATEFARGRIYLDGLK